MFQRIAKPFRISIHALLAESDVTAHTWQGGTTGFLSTLSLRRATAEIFSRSSMSCHFYPRSPCGERLPDGILKGDGKHISIHALLAESDTSILHKILADWDFYPRSPCGERLEEVEKLSRVTVISIHALLAESDCPSSAWRSARMIFLSTLSLRRATVPDRNISTSYNDFYPRSPCGERRRGAANCYLDNIISIHALLAESDVFLLRKITITVDISIHALLAESD